MHVKEGMGLYCPPPPSDPPPRPPPPPTMSGAFRLHHLMQEHENLRS